MKVPVYETIISSYTQKVFLSCSVAENSFEIEFETDRKLSLDMRDTHLSLNLQFFKGQLFDAFKKKGKIRQNQRMNQKRNQNLT